METEYKKEEWTKRQLLTLFENDLNMKFGGYADMSDRKEFLDKFLKENEQVKIN